MSTIALQGGAISLGSDVEISTGNITRSFSPWGSMATLQIIVEQTGNAGAGEGVFFRTLVDGFDVSAPEAGQEYDPRFHEVYYFWDFGRDHTFDRLVNVLPEWRNGRTAFGPFVSACFNDPGIYTVSCTAIDRSGRRVTTTVEVTVNDPDVMYPGTQTICLAHDGDFTGKPTGAAEAATLTEALSAMEALDDGDLKGRIMFKGGGTYDYSGDTINILSAHSNMWWQTWGGGRATFNVLPTAALNDGEPLIKFSNSLTFIGGSALFQDIDFTGPWDSTTETGKRHTALFLSTGSRNLDLSINNCTSDGMQGLQAAGTYGGSGRGPMIMAFDCRSTNNQDFSFYSDQGTYLLSLVGCISDQDVQARQGGGAKQPPWKNDHTGVRMQQTFYTYFDALEIFARNGWVNSQSVPENQPCIRYHSNVPGSKASMNRLSCEGGNDIITGGDATPSGVLRPVNWIIDKAVLVGSSRTGGGAIGNGLGGTTIRNVLTIMPNVPSINRPNYGFGGAPGSSDAVGDDNLAQRVAWYSNTILFLTDDTNLDGTEPNFITSGASTRWTNEVEENNLFVAPLSTHMRQSDNAELTDFDGSTLWAPRWLGHKYDFIGGTQLTMDATFATPADTVKDMTPLAATPADPGFAAFDDIRGRPRYDATTGLISGASKGAFEPAD
ncbi:hypothetical protein [Roseobacter sp. S98]|uniref:hypothetical protein n=1 Tax=Roseobacter algicola (ex Choi et al. 2025) (nom. illeg.) TaxID=3092138 RepID=UPI003F51785A